MLNVKGIILAGGLGSRLYPLTISVSKQMLPVYDKPMIYYPLSNLMELGIREIMLISSPAHFDSFKLLLGTGERWGIEITYAVQKQPKGIAEAFLLGEEFLNGSSSTLILGDNLFIFSTASITHSLKDFGEGSQALAYAVANPSDYGVVVFEKNGKPKTIIEKPAEFISNFAIPGIYQFDASVSEIAKSLKPSDRQEYEITDLLKEYLKTDLLRIKLMPRGNVWLDMGSFDQLQGAGQLVNIMQLRQGVLIGSPDLIAINKGWTSWEKISMQMNNYPASNTYLNNLSKFVKEMI